MSLAELSDRVEAISESATLALNAHAKNMAAEGKTVYNLTAGELASDTPEYIQKHVATTLEQNKYTPVSGLVELRKAIAKEASAFYGKSFTEENVVVTAGAKPALYASILALVNPGDEVIIPKPMWVSYRYLVELAGGKVVDVVLTEEFDLDPEKIQAAITSKTKAIILNSPINPTGAIFSGASLYRLAEGLKGKGIAVISDDIYAKLVYTDSFSPAPTHDFEETIIINGFSKSQALTGWRIGYIIADKRVAGASAKLLSHMMGNASVQSQQAALAALDKGDKPPALDYLSVQKDSVCKLLSGIPGVSFHEPEGAFYVFLDIREITQNSKVWCEKLLVEKGVALVPGEAFGAPGFARLSFVADEQIITEGIEQIKEFISK